MKKLKSILRFSAMLIAVVAFAVVCYPSSSTLARATGTGIRVTISQLAWMSGDWQITQGAKVQIEEHWMAPAGGSMIGMGRTIKDGRTVEFEFLRIEERDGQIYYVANPQGRCPATDFKLTHMSSQEVIFENPDHDFPKRVIYRRNSDGSLTASVDGGPGTKANSFAYRPM